MQSVSAEQEGTLDGVSLAEPVNRALLPARAFTSQAFFDAELTHVFERGWVHVADLPELTKPGDFVAAQIGRVPVVVVRDEAGELRGFVNACRHRGATLVDGTGNCGRHLRCPYHAWTYTTDGRLTGVPFREQFEGHLGELGLVAIRVASAGPLVFGCLDDRAPDFSEWAGQLCGALDACQAATMVPAFDYVYEVPVNWKVYVENALDGYHVRFVHDVLAGVLARLEDGKSQLETYASYSYIPLDPNMTAPELDGQLPAGEAYFRFGCVLPNLIPVLSPLDLTYLRIDPLGPDRIRLVGRSFDHGGGAEQSRPLRRMVADQTNAQDIEVVKRVQRGLAGGRVQPLVHAELLEQRIGHFEHMLLRELRRGLAGDLVALRRAG